MGFSAMSLGRFVLNSPGARKRKSVLVLMPRPADDGGNLYGKIEHAAFSGVFSRDEMILNFPNVPPSNTP